MKIIGELRAILGLDKTKFDQGLKGAEKGGQKFGASMKSIFASMGAALGIKELIRFGLEAAKLAGKAEAVRAAFGRLNNPTLLQNLRKATQNTVSDVQLMTNAIRANNFRLPLEQLPKYFEFATKRARETGESVEYLVDSIVLGISRESPKILDNLGLSLAEINEELKHTPNYAVAVGNIIDRELKKAGRSSDDAGVKFLQFSAAWEGFKEESGKLVNKSGLPNLLQRMSTQMRILGEESLSAGKKIAMMAATRIDSGAFDNYLDKLNKIKEAASSTAFNPVAGFAASVGMGRFNMLDKIIPPKAETVQDLIDKLAVYDEQIAMMPTSEAAEIAAIVKSKKALEDRIDALTGTVKALDKVRKAMDKDDLWNSLVNPTATPDVGVKSTTTTNFRGNNLQLFADPTQLANMQENLVTLGSTYDELAYRAAGLSNIISGVFYDAITSGEGIFDAMGESLKRLASQFAASALAAATLAAAIMLIPGLGQMFGIGKSATFGGLFGALMGKSIGAADGLSVPSGYPNDSFGPVMLTSGETVLTAKQSSWLRDGLRVNVSGEISARAIALVGRRGSYSN
jgi:hypothetical protein